MFENWWSNHGNYGTIDPNEIGSAYNSFFGSDKDKNKDGFFASIGAFFTKIKELLNTVLFGRYYPPVFEYQGGFTLPKLVKPAKDTRVYVWHLVAVLSLIYLVRLAFGNLDFLSRKR